MKMPQGFRMVAFGEYSDDGTASTLKRRDYKDATDLVVTRAYSTPHNIIGRSDQAGGNGQQFMEEISYTLDTRKEAHAVAYAIRTAQTSSNGWGISEESAYTLDRAKGQAICLMDQGGSNMNVEVEKTGTLRAQTHGHEPIIIREREGKPGGGKGALLSTDKSFTIQRTNDQVLFERRDNREVQDYAVRRLTPKECERLQGFPDGWTQIAYRGKAAEDCPDGPRYEALGNSMAVPCMRWIGERIQMIEEEESSFDL